MAVSQVAQTDSEVSCGKSGLQYDQRLRIDRQVENVGSFTKNMRLGKVSQIPRESEIGKE